MRTTNYDDTSEIHLKNTDAKLLKQLYKYLQKEIYGYICMYIRNIYRHSYIILIKVTYSIQHTVLHKFINIYASQNSTVECVQIFKTNQLNVGSFATSVAYSSLNKYSIVIIQ